MTAPAVWLRGSPPQIFAYLKRHQFGFCEKDPKHVTHTSAVSTTDRQVYRRQYIIIPLFLIRRQAIFVNDCTVLHVCVTCGPTKVITLCAQVGTTLTV